MPTPLSSSFPSGPGWVDRRWPQWLGLGVGALFVVMGAAQLGTDTRVALSLLVFGVVFVLFGWPNRAPNGSIEQVVHDGRPASAIPTRSPAVKLGLGFVLAGGLILAGAIAAVSNDDLTNTQFLLALLVGGLGGTLILALGLMTLNPRARKNSPALITPSGFGWTIGGELTWTPWNQVSAIEPRTVRIGNVWPSGTYTAIAFIGHDGEPLLTIRTDQLNVPREVALEALRAGLPAQ